MNSNVVALYGNNPDRRRAEEGERKTYDPQNLWEHHHEILNLLSMGLRPKDIAERLNITVATVSNIRNSTLGREKLKLLRVARDAEAINVRAEIEQLVPAALQVYKKILEQEGTPDRLMKDVADTVVKDLGGHAAPKKVEASISHLFDGDSIEEFKQRGKAAALAAGIIVEGEIVEDSSEDS